MVTGVGLNDEIIQFLCGDMTLYTQHINFMPKSLDPCLVHPAPHLKGVVRHIGLVHSQEPGFRVTCGICGCAPSYNNIVSYNVR